MTVVQVIAALLAAIVIPPLGLSLAERNVVWIIVTSVLFVAAQTCFWIFFALPGLALWVGTIGISIVLILLPLERKA